MYSILTTEVIVSASNLFMLAGCIALVGAIISSICWICLSFTWWRLEKRRIKKNQESEKFGIL